MAASSTAVTVLAPNGRRQTVKVSPSTPIQQILEEVCKKQNSSPDEYDLKFQRTVLNLSLQWRFANLPNNAKLEMVPSTRQRAGVESTVRIALQLEDGSRLQDSFSCGQTLWELINHFPQTRVPGPQLSESTPLCVYMRDEIAGEEALKKMTLKSLGLTGGSAIVRYIVKKSKVLEQTEMMQTGAAVEAKPKEEVEPSAGVEAAPCKKDVEIPVEKPASSAISTVVQNNTAEAVSHKKESVLNLDIKEEAVRLVPIKDEAIKKQETKPEPSSECPGPSSERPKNIKQEPSAAPDPTPSTFVPFSGGGQRLGGPGAEGQEAAGKLSSSSSVASLSSPGGPPKAKKFKTCSESGAKKSLGSKNEEPTTEDGEGFLEPIDREALVYHMDAEHRQRGEVFTEDLPDEFFQVTVDDIRKRFAQLKSEREVLEEAPLLTKSLRESRMKEKIQRYPKVVVRVQFPDRHVLQGFFRPLETVGAVREFVRKHLEDPDLRFYLFISPPKVILNDLTDTLFQANLFPAALVYFGSDFKTDCYLQKQILNSTVSSSQADGAIAGCMPRSPTPSSSSVASEATFPLPAEKDARSNHQSTAADEPQPHSNSQAPKPVNTDPGKIPKWLKLSGKR